LSDIHLIVTATFILVFLAILYQLFSKKLINTIFGTIMMFIASIIIISYHSPNLEVFLFVTIAAMNVVMLAVFAIKIEHIENKTNVMED